jgi:hypothetical protein
VKEDAVLDELAKQLSAFANMGGGRIIYGVNNAGSVDNGGVARVLKGRQSSKEWLEDVIPTLTDYEITGFHVYEITPKASSSAIAHDKSLYIVDVPDSDRAPHQSVRDYKYYVRLGGKSQPAPHRMIEDIRNRARHPKLETQDVHIQNAGYIPNQNQNSGTLTVYLQFRLHNNSNVRAANACLMLSANIPLSTKYGAGGEISNRPAPQGTVIFELQNPMYPRLSVVLNPMVVFGAAINLDGACLLIEDLKPNEVQLKITTYADSAPATEQNFVLANIDPRRQLQRIETEEYNRAQMRSLRP